MLSRIAAEQIGPALLEGLTLRRSSIPLKGKEGDIDVVEIILD